MPRLISLVLVLLYGLGYAQMAHADRYYADRCQTADPSTITETHELTYGAFVARCHVYPSHLSTDDCVYTTARNVIGGTEYFFFACPYGADWSAYDTDQDGIANGSDAEPFVYNEAEETDTDGDGVPDSQDPCPNSADDTCDDGDNDGDGVLNGNDVCPNDYNDLCVANDTDQDGVPNASDICPNDALDLCVANDTDQDGLANDVDPCPTDASNQCAAYVDTDGDGIPDNIDECPEDDSNTCNDPEDPDITCDLYTPGEDTMLAVVSDVKTQLEASPIITEAASLFDVTNASGSCPTWTIPFLQSSVDLTFQCSEFFDDALYLARLVILLGATIIAYRWAFL